MDRIRPCGLCVRAEFADEDSDGLNYIARPDAKVAHVERPSGSFGTGGAFQAMAWLARERQPYTYCGLPIYRESDGWTEVNPHE